MSYWERTWKERTDAVLQAFGPTDPPDMVESFSWSDRIRCPGACALVFPPIEAQRDPVRQARKHWLYLTLGLSQPLNQKEVKASRAAGNQESGHGYEMAMLTLRCESWVASALRTWITVITDGHETGDGHRFPFGFCKQGEQLIPFIGFAADFGVEAYGTIRAALHFPLLASAAHFCTSTGTFRILVAIGITEDEWEFAKQTSSVHLQLLLVLAGIGQRTEVERLSVVASEPWSRERDRITNLSPQECWEELQGRIAGTC